MTFWSFSEPGFPHLTLIVGKSRMAATGHTDTLPGLLPPLANTRWFSKHPNVGPATVVSGKDLYWINIPGVLAEFLQGGGTCKKIPPKKALTSQAANPHGLYPEPTTPRRSSRRK